MGFLNFVRQLWDTPPRHSIEHREINRASKKRRYDGAKRGRLYGDWFTSNASANAELWTSLTTLRDRSRDLCRNNDYAKGVIQKLVDNLTTPHEFIRGILASLKIATNRRLAD